MPAPIWWLLALPFAAGACLPLQAGINGQLAKQVSSVLAAALISFAVGTLALLLVVVVVVVTQRELPDGGALKGLTWWHWSGGLLGVIFIATAAFAGPRVGALLFMVRVIAGQLGMALLLDHFGWAGFREAPISLGKVAGLLLIVAGIWLIRRG